MFVLTTRKVVVKSWLRDFDVVARDKNSTLSCHKDTLFDHTLSPCFEIARKYTNKILLVKRVSYNLNQQDAIYTTLKIANWYGYIVIEVENFFSKWDTELFTLHCHISNLTYYYGLLTSSIRVMLSEPNVILSTQIYERIEKIKLYFNVFPELLNSTNPIVRRCIFVITNTVRFLKTKGITTTLLDSHKHYEDGIHLIQNAYSIVKAISRDNFVDISHKWRYYKQALLRLRPLHSHLSLLSNKHKYRRFIVFYPKYRDIINGLCLSLKQFLHRCRAQFSDIKKLERVIRYNESSLVNEWRANRLNYVGNIFTNIYVRGIYFESKFIGVQFSNDVFLTEREFKNLKYILRMWFSCNKPTKIVKQTLNTRLTVHSISKGYINFQFFKVSVYEVCSIIY